MNYEDESVRLMLGGKLRRSREELERENTELRAGKCRFNCRTQKEAFIAGYEAARLNVAPATVAFREWRREQRNETPSKITPESRQ